MLSGHFPGLMSYYIILFSFIKSIWIYTSVSVIIAKIKLQLGMDTVQADQALMQFECFLGFFILEINPIGKWTILFFTDQQCSFNDLFTLCS